MATALIIDNDRDVTETLAFVLQEAGHKALTALDTDAGTLLVREDAPDIVLADIDARGVCGLDRIRAIRSVDPGARIIAMSGDSLALHDACLKQAEQLGAMALLPKPFEADELLSIVSSCLAVSPALQ